MEVESCFERKEKAEKEGLAVIETGCYLVAEIDKTNNSNSSTRLYVNVFKGLQHRQTGKQKKRKR